MPDSVEAIDGLRWLLLIHRLPPKPDYLRVKLRRRLQGIGAVPLKRTVYVLPLTEQSHEDFEWLAREIRADGGEATMCEATFLDVTTDKRLVEAFQTTHAAAYAEIEDAARRESPDAERLKRRLAAVTALDHFGAPGRPDAEAALEALVTRRDTVPPDAGVDSEAPRGRTWVTRTGVHVDRIASAWLIRRFIDPEARFRCVAPKGHRAEPGELRFDMFEGEFTHEGDSCTFETLCRRFRLADAALTAIGEIVHDIDFKDNRFDRPETAGIRMVIDGIARSHPDDAARLERGAAVLDDLYGQFRKSRR
ncbi:MAG TPA: chromate resistance protein ChrB domain-containing protein [Gemmatimonadales bacterium]|jgi:hypothetical protein